MSKSSLSPLHDADHSALDGIRRFVHTLRLDLAAVRNAITENWSSGRTEGQINRLKMPKLAMYGRAGVAQCSTCPPSAYVRHASIAAMTRRSGAAEVVGVGLPGEPAVAEVGQRPPCHSVEGTLRAHRHRVGRRGRCVGLGPARERHAVLLVGSRS